MTRAPPQLLKRGRVAVAAKVDIVARNERPAEGDVRVVHGYLASPLGLHTLEDTLIATVQPRPTRAPCGRSWTRRQSRMAVGVAVVDARQMAAPTRPEATDALVRNHPGISTSSRRPASLQFPIDLIERGLQPQPHLLRIGIVYLQVMKQLPGIVAGL